MTGIRSNARAIHHCFSTQEANTTEGPRLPHQLVDCSNPSRRLLQAPIRS